CRASSPRRRRTELAAASLHSMRRSIIPRVPALALAAILALLLAACASKDPAPHPSMPDPLPPAKPPEVSPQRRADLHTDLGAGYYERGQMDIALEELNEAVKIDPNYAKAYNIYGLV